MGFFTKSHIGKQRKIVKRHILKTNHGVAEKILLVIFASCLIMSMILMLR